MKNLFTFFLLFITITLSAQEASPFMETNSDRPRDPRADQMNFVANEVLVKFKDEVLIQGGTNLKSAGISSVDQILKANGVVSLDKLFPSEMKLKRAQILKDPTGRDMKIPSLHNIYRITIPQLKSTGSVPADIFKFMEELKALPEVEYAEPNYVFNIGDFKPAGREMTMLEAMAQIKNEELSETATGLVPNDPLYNSQWGIPATKIDVVWNTTTGDATSVIAILDTGVDWQHPDLAANIWENKGEIPGNGADDDGNGLIDDIRGWDYINNDNNPTDDNSHGTHVAGIAAAVGNNGIGIAGANWKAKIMPIKVFQSSGKGDAATIAKGITYAASKGATVINMSFGSYVKSLTMENAIINAYATSVLVAAAGNDAIEIGPCGDCAPMYPGAYSFVLGVEANLQNSGICGIRACFSNYDLDGPVFSRYAELYNYELKAPGVEILSCVPGGNYREYTGTSMATPLVSGAISLYRKQKPTESQEMLFGSFINSINRHFDLEKALNIIPTPKLDIISYAIADTIDGDRDGRPDAGETIEIKVKVRNTWGQANDVKVGLEFGEFEDPSIATILNAEANVGSISAYATKENIVNLKIKISANASNNRDVVLILKSWYGDKQGQTNNPLNLNTENGVQIQGNLSGHHVWDGSRQIILTNNVQVDVNDTLVIMPGTRILVRPNKFIQIKGTLICRGTPENPISFDVQSSGVGSIFEFFGFYSQTPLVLDSSGNYLSGSIISYTNFTNLKSIYITGNELFEYNNVSNCPLIYGYNANIRNNLFEDIIGTNRIGIFNLTNSTFKNNIITNCYYKTRSGDDPMIIARGTNFTGNYIARNELNYDINPNQYLAVNRLFMGYDKVTNNTFVNNYTNHSNYIQNEDYDNSYIVHYNGDMTYPYFYNNSVISNGFEFSVGYLGSSPYTDLKMENNYWGTNQSSEIDKLLWDKNDDFTFGYVREVLYKPILTEPPKECPAFVQQILVDNNPIGQEALGVGIHRFDIVFSRAMDTSYKPIVSFGVRVPYTQNTIIDTSQWDESRKVFTVYKYIQLFTGDGINRIRVAGARDIEGFDLPVDDRRFNFIISAASSASADFMATPSLGKVKLEWNSNDLADGLGFNMYRMEHINSTNLSQPVMVNASLITDTLYTDFSVTPNKKYYYYYKILRTNLSETDSSKVVSAIPFTASKGDANGDLTVNVLDITTIVAFLLNNNPQPFITEAADLNNDGNINVLDIVGVVNLVLGGPKSAVIATTEQVKLYLQNDTLFADAPVAIGGLQFDISGSASVDEIQKLKALEGFESGYSSNDKGLRLIYYSLSGKTIQAGKRIPLLKLKKGSGVSGAIFGDKTGTSIPVNYLATGVWNLSDNLNQSVAELGQNYPNPLTKQTSIPIRINEPVDEAVIRVVNVMGQEVEVIRIDNPIVGEHLLNWNSGANKGLMAYLLEIRRGNQRFICPVKKMVVK